MDILPLERRIDSINTEARIVCSALTEKTSDYFHRLRERISESGLEKFLFPWRAEERFSELTPDTSYGRIRGFFTPAQFELQALTGSMFPVDSIRPLYAMMESYMRHWEQYERQMDKLRVGQRDAYAELVRLTSYRQLTFRDSKQALLYCAVPGDDYFWLGRLDMVKGSLDIGFVRMRVRKSALGRWWNRRQIKHSGFEGCANAFLVTSPSSRITGSLAVSYAAGRILEERAVKEGVRNQEAVTGREGFYRNLFGTQIYVAIDGKDFVKGSGELN
jgi:hypothetical protein